MNLETIISIVNIAFTGLFIAIIVALLVAALLGLKKGIIRVAYKLIFIVTLVLVAVFTLDPFVKFFYKLPLNIGFQTIVISQGDLTYYAPITNFYDTSYYALKGIYLVLNVSSSSASAHAFAVGLTTTITKFLIFMTEMSLIVTLGNVLGEVLWKVAFSKFIPASVREKKSGKIPAAILNVVKSFVIAILFISPLTSILNSVNQSYQRYKANQTDHQVSEIGSFIDAYNSSIFAQVFFNWTVDENGMTFDAAILNSITNTDVEGQKVGFVSELTNLSDAVIGIVDSVTGITDGNVAFETSTLLNEGMIKSVIKSLQNSDFLTLLIPIAAELVVNSDILEQKPEILKYLDISDTDWQNDLSNIAEFALKIVDTGILDELIDEDGKLAEFNSAKAVSLIKKVLSKEPIPNYDGKTSSYDMLMNGFKSLSNTKLFTRAMAALVQFALESAGEEITKYICLGKDDVLDINWGMECYILVDALTQLVTIDERFIDAIVPEDSDPNESVVKVKKAEESKLDLIDLLGEMINDPTKWSKVKLAFVGDLNDSSKVDTQGRTIVFKNGNKINDRSYCLLDLTLVSKIFAPAVNNLLAGDLINNADIQIADTDKQYLNDVLLSLNEGAKVMNYKKEFNSILDVFNTLGGAIDDLKELTDENSEFNKNGKDVFSLPTSLINTIGNAIKKIDNCKLVYAFAAGYFKALLKSPTLQSTLVDTLGADLDIMSQGIENDKNSSTHKLFTEIGSLLDLWGDLSGVIKVVNDASGDSNKMLDIFKGDTKIALAKTLTKIYSLSFFNPDPQPGQTFSHNENFFNVIEHFTSQLPSNLGITIARDDLLSVESEGHSWINDFNGNIPVKNSNGEYGEIYNICNIIEGLITRNLLNIGDLDFTQSSTFRKLANNGTDDYDLPGLLSLVGKSVVFVKVIGPFMDKTINSTGLLDVPGNTTNIGFSNVQDWEQESVKLKSLLISLADLFDECGSDFLNNFNLNSISNIASLNDLLHKLADSDIFKDRVNAQKGSYSYSFGKWLYCKISDALGSFEFSGSSVDLLKDPSNWDSTWGDKASDKYYVEYAQSFAKSTDTNTHYLSFKDFVCINGADNVNNETSWCDITTFNSLNSTFTINPEWKNNSYGGIYGSDDFINAYNNIFEVDELGKLCKSLTYVLRLMNAPGGLTISSIDENLIKSVLSSLNETSCLRMSIYNFVDLIKSSLGSDASANKYLSLNSINSEYLVDCDTNDLATQRSNRQHEIDAISTLVGFYQTLSNSGVLSSSIDINALKTPGLYDELFEGLEALATSKIFHLAGSPIMSANSYSPTFFQNLMATLMIESSLSQTLYCADSEKDVAWASRYESILEKPINTATLKEKQEAKVNYLIKDFYKTNNDMPLLSEGEKQVVIQNEVSEVKNFIEIIARVLGGTFDSNTYPGLSSDGKIENINLETISSDQINALLKKINSSEVIYDLAPNILNNSLKSVGTGSAFGSIDFSSISTFYYYTYNGTVSVNYQRKMPENEIDAITNLITDYQDIKNVLGSKTSLMDRSVLEGLVSGGIIDNLLTHTSSSESMHLYNKNNKSGVSELTFHEQIIRELLVQSTLAEKAYSSTYDSTYANAIKKLEANIKQTSLENEGKVSISGYHSTWGGTNGENKAITSLIQTALNTVSGNLDFSSLNVNSLTPSKLYNILVKLNNVDLIKDAVPTLLNEGFDSCGFNSLATYDSVNYAYFRLPQTVYGGTTGAAGEGSELYLLKLCLENVYVNNSYISLSDMAQIPSKITNLDNFMNFITNSHILNTRISDGTYGELNVVSGKNISARGVFMYNLLGGSSSTSVVSYVTGSNALEKVHALSSIYKLSDYSYLVEAKGIYSLMSKSGDIDASSFSANDFEDVKAIRPTLISLMETSYNAFNSKRSYFVSEIVGGILQNMIVNERNRITTMSLSYQNATFSFKPASYNQITNTSYDNLNANEKRGLDSMFDLLDMIMDLFSASPSVSKASLEEAFAGMDNSELARIFYLSRIHKKTTGDVGERLDFTQSYAAIFVYGSVWSDYTSDVYSTTFSFANYGKSLSTYLGLA